MRKIFFSILIASTLVSCKKDNEYLPPAFNYEIPDVPVTVDVHTGAYYYNYTTTDWGRKYTGTPVLGQYSALNAATMTQHRSWADRAKLDFFIFNWNGASAGNPLLTSFINGRTENVKMVINYNNAHLSATNASPLTGAKLTTMLNELKTLAAAHFDKDYYFRIGDQPVILITPLNLSTNSAASIDYTTVIPAVKQALSEVGFTPYIIGEITSGWLPPQRYAPAIKAMNGVTLSNWATDNYDRYNFFPSYSDINWQNWKDSTTAWGTVDFVPAVFPGYNDKQFSPTSKIYDIDRTEKFYKDYCNVAKRNMSDRRIVLINSWNHFQLGTSLEPAAEYGEAFLDATRINFKKP